MRATIADGRPRTLMYRADLTGKVIKRDESDNNSSAGDPHELWYYYGGKERGYVTNNGTLETNDAASIANRTATQGSGAFRNGSTTSVSFADFDQSIAPINSFAQGAAGGEYIVRAGDTFSSIAAQLWGDSAL